MPCLPPAGITLIGALSWLRQGDHRPQISTNQRAKNQSVIVEEPRQVNQLPFARSFQMNYCL